MTKKVFCLQDNLLYGNLFQKDDNQLKEYIENYEQIFDLKEMGKYGLLNIYGSFFRKNNYIGKLI